VDAIAANFPGVEQVPTEKVIREYWGKWSQAHGEEERFGSLSQGTLRRFLTDKKIESGLQLSPERVEEAWKFAQVQYEQGILTSWNLFLGNRAGSFGETSILACLIGAGVLILTGVGSWRTMIGVLVGVVGTAGAFKILLSNFGADVGAWTPAMCSFSPYKHLLLGGVMFGAVFMATDPVSSPVLRLSRWIYGALIGFLVMIIRMLSPAYPEGTMLAIILGNVASPLIDHHVARWYRRKACVTV
jgi:Na+-transporting NADH:ubiquinone oxidoreductase subunit B